MRKKGRLSLTVKKNAPFWRRVLRICDDVNWQLLSEKSEDFERCFWYFANALVKLNLFDLRTRKHLGDSVQIKE